MMDEHSWEGNKWLDLITEEEEGDYYIRTKKRLSAFYPTDLEFLLHNLDVHNVVLTGTMTDACVLSTAFDAANRDFRVIVPQGRGRRLLGGGGTWRTSGDLAPPRTGGRRPDPARGVLRPSRNGVASDLVGIDDINEVTGLLQKSTV